MRDFLADLGFAGKAANTIRAYRSDLAELAQHDGAGVDQVDAAVLRSYFVAIADLAPSTTARKQASCAAFLRWAVRHGLITANPLDLLDRVQVPEGAPRPSPPGLDRPNHRDHRERSGPRTSRNASRPYSQSAPDWAPVSWPSRTVTGSGADGDQAETSLSSAPMGDLASNLSDPNMWTRRK